jgi:hypothetical protein
MTALHIRFGAGLTVAVVTLIALAFGQAADAGSTVAELRAEAPGAVLEPGAAYATDTARIKTDPGAECFGDGTGGTGSRVTVPGATALGLVDDGAAVNPLLRPISVSDHFGFGLAVCGFGGHQAGGSSSWYLKVNHVGAQVGGDQYHLGYRDRVLWYLAPSYPYPDELALAAPGSAKPGVPVDVHVSSFADDGTGSSAAGASVAGADSPATTDSDGDATVTVTDPGTATLRATRGSDIPSNSVPVCVSAAVGACPAHHGLTIYGTAGADRIRGTAGWDVIRSRGGDDEVDVRFHGKDRVNCGSGDDVVHVDGRDVTVGCEEVLRR